jgi:hypothetical protein
MKNDFPAALKDLDEVVRHNPGIPLALLVRSRARLRTGDFEGALHDIDGASRFEPPDPRLAVLNATPLDHTNG